MTAVLVQSLKGVNVLFSWCFLLLLECLVLDTHNRPPVLIQDTKLLLPLEVLLQGRTQMFFSGDLLLGPYLK